MIFSKDKHYFKSLFYNNFEVKFLYLITIFLVIILFTISGCGLRESQTGSIYGIVLNAKGDVVAQALVYSLQKEYEKVYTGNDGVFYISELQAGNHTLIIRHPNYKQEVVQVTVKPNETLRILPIKLLDSVTQKFFSNINIENVGSTHAIISWRTYKELICELEYGETQNYTHTLKEDFPSIEHKLKLTNLNPETLYHFRIKFTDSFGVQWYSYDYTFKTLSSESPAPPASVSVSLVSYGCVKINWSYDNKYFSSVTGYNVWRLTLNSLVNKNINFALDKKNLLNSSSWILLSTDGLDRNTNEFLDTTAEGGHSYVYAVTAFNQFKANSIKAMSNKIFMPGYINKNITLYYDESPYVLFSDIIVSPNVTLTVEPGVEFYVSQNDRFGLGENPNNVEILVQGRINLVGSENKPIKFLPLDSVLTNDFWAGIKIAPSNFEKSTINNVWISGCKPYAVSINNSNVNLENISLKLCYSGIYLNNVKNNLFLKNINFDEISSSSLVISNCRNLSITNSSFYNTDYGIIIASSKKEDIIRISENYVESKNTGVYGRFGSFIIKNNIINTPNGIAIDIKSAAGNQKVIDHCTINAKIGIHIASDSAIVENNLIINLEENGEKGIWVSSPFALVFSYNNLYGFTTPYSGCSAGVGAKNYPPAFVGGKPFSWQIVSASPLKYADKYGSEIGRYGKSYY